ncbi:MAG: YidC/Oxa1 family membrane protein insertase [Solirubrobacterales bacterium]
MIGPLAIAGPLDPLARAALAVMDFCHDQLGFGWGLSIVAVTVVVRTLILPLSIKQIRSMRAMQALQPQLKELQEKHKDDKQRLQQEMISFYKDNNVNPFASCLPLLLQFPVFIALFYALRSPDFTERIQGTVRAGGTEGWLFIDALDKIATGGELVVLMVLYTGTQLASSLVMLTAATDKTQRTIMLALPFVFLPFIVRFPAGLIVYWITTNTWTIGQQAVVRKLAPPPDIQEKIEERKAEAKAPPPPPRKKRKQRSGKRR